MRFTLLRLVLPRGTAENYRVNRHWHAVIRIPSAANHSVSIRGSRCTALIYAFAEEPSRWPSSSAVIQQLWDVTFPFLPSGNEGYICNRDVPFQSVTASHVGGPTKLGFPTKAPQELPLPAPCVGLLILPIRQTIGPGSKQRRSITAVPRETQTVGFE